MNIYIKAGHGFKVGEDFARVKVDTLIELAPKEYAHPHHVIGYIMGTPNHPLRFMRGYPVGSSVRVHVRRDCLTEY